MNNREVDNKAEKNHTNITQVTFIVGNGNRTEWSPIQSVIIRVITKSDDRAAGVRFVYRLFITTSM